MTNQLTNQSHQSNADQPPVPGGDPDERPRDLPAPAERESMSDVKGQEKTGYGHIGNKEVPRPEGAPKPHQIF